MQVPKHILALIEKYQKGNASAEEKLQLKEWYQSFDDETVEIFAEKDDTEELLAARLKSKILKTITEEQPAKIMDLRWKKIAAVAAIIIGVLTTGLYFFNTSKPAEQNAGKITSPEKMIKNDIAPGGNKALLTLADGSTIVLDSASKGTITQQGNIAIQKLDNGLIAYTVNGKQITENDAAFYNTISTPRGGQYEVTLSDGTKVWLNAASSIKFPVVFVGNQRKVNITGEAYFEVAKNKDKPFNVQTPATVVEVLGTHFNVNAYEDEAAVKTTLLEGAIKVNAINQVPKILQPGQQSAIDKNGNNLIIADADIEQAMAWRNGNFQFKSTDLKTILRQISRWYDVDIVYQGNVNFHFTGQLTRNENVSKVFEKLALTNTVHFKIDGKKIIVSP